MFDISIEAQVKYLRRRIGELELILQGSVEQVDLEHAKKIGHQVKGNASTFGLDSLSERAIKLENAALAADKNLVFEICKDLRKEVQNLMMARNAY